LGSAGRARELHECVGRLPPPDRMPIPLLLACAAQYSNLNQQERAIALLDEAKRADPRYPPTLIARGQVLTYLGRFAEAEADLAASIARAPEIARSWWLLSRLGKQAPQRNHVEAIQAQLRRPGRKPADVALLAYALHKELDDLGRHAEAWDALETACRAKRATLSYERQETEALVSELIAFPAPADVPGPGRDERVPVFIVGMHRSGTTLLEQLLDGHPDVRGIGELYDFTTQMRYAADHHCRGVIDMTIVQRARGADFGAIGSGYLDSIEWRLGRERFFTDKLPSNFLNLGFICQALPHARILHMTRDPVETCFSNLRELFSDACQYSYDQAELAHYHRQYRRLMAHWHQRYPGRILDVDYAELTAEPEAVLRRVAAFCGFDFHRDMLQLEQRTRGIATASSIQVRAGITRRSSPKWAAYEQQLQPLIRAL
jgi:tetratricopeptide (TPR) repeat protein